MCFCTHRRPNSVSAGRTEIFLPEIPARASCPSILSLPATRAGLRSAVPQSNLQDTYLMIWTRLLGMKGRFVLRCPNIQTCKHESCQALPTSTPDWELWTSQLQLRRGIFHANLHSHEMDRLQWKSVMQVLYHLGCSLPRSRILFKAQCVQYIHAWDPVVWILGSS
jgi:hypothetical protein